MYVLVTRIPVEEKNNSPPKCTKNLNIHYSPILHVCMNNRIVKARFENFRILLDSGCSSTIVMGRLFEKLCLEKYAVIQWHTQAGNITTNLKVKVYLTLPVLRSMNGMMWKCHMDDSSKGWYNMILGLYLLTELLLNLKFSEYVIEADDEHFKGSTTPMVDLGTYDFKDLNTVKIIPE